MVIDRDWVFIMFSPASFRASCVCADEQSCQQRRHCVHPAVVTCPPRCAASRCRRRCLLILWPICLVALPLGVHFWLTQSPANSDSQWQRAYPLVQPLVQRLVSGRSSALEGAWVRGARVGSGLLLQTSPAHARGGVPRMRGGFAPDGDPTSTLAGYLWIQRILLLLGAVGVLATLGRRRRVRARYSARARGP